MTGEEEAFVQLCKDVFTSMDLDKNGRITPYIVGQVMKQYGWNPKPYELVKMISDVDDDDNGYITVEEFIPLMTQVIHEDKYLEDEVMEIFMNFGNEKRLLSSDALISKLVIAGNGLLTSEDIKDMLEQVEKRPGPYDCRSAAYSIYEHILEKEGKGRKSSSRQKTSSMKVAMMLGIKYRNKKLGE